MKYCIEKYPMGSFKGQRSPGRMMDGWLYQNLEKMAEKIVEDMTFMGVIYSSTLEVGTGKSVLGTQIGEAWQEIIFKKHGIKLPYDVNNLVWKPRDLIKKAFKIPKYSYLLLDEWEDSTYWSELGISLRQFFRKCRQLNLFIMCIIPNWFQLPLSYAVSRSIFAIDVKFNDQLDRGFFSFYNFPSKRALYIIGKRTHNYWASKPTFNGRFGDGYGVNEKEYREKKLKDMMTYEEEHPVRKTKSQIEKAVSMKVLKNLNEQFPKMTILELSKLFGVAKDTISVWKRENVSGSLLGSSNYNNKPIVNNGEKITEGLDSDE